MVSISEDSGFRSRSGDRISWLMFSSFSSVAPAKCRDARFFCSPFQLILYYSSYHLMADVTIFSMIWAVIKRSRIMMPTSKRQFFPSVFCRCSGCQKNCLLCSLQDHRSQHKSPSSAFSRHIGVTVDGYLRFRRQNVVCLFPINVFKLIFNLHAPSQSLKPFLKLSLNISVVYLHPI